MWGSQNDHRQTFILERGCAAQPHDLTLPPFMIFCNCQTYTYGKFPDNSAEIFPSAIMRLGRCMAFNRNCYLEKHRPKRAYNGCSLVDRGSGFCGSRAKAK